MTGAHDLALVFVSYLVAVIASFTALEATSRVHAAQSRLGRRIWLLSGAGAMGLGIWSMHFIGMLAFKLPIVVSYHLGLTALSLVIAIAGSAIGLSLVSQSAVSRRRLGGAGIALGSAIVAMHYTGMFAMEVYPPIVYRKGIFFASVGIAIAAATTALWISVRLRAESLLSAFPAKSGAALVMGLAICGMHYTGMAAAQFAPGTFCYGDATQLDSLDGNWLGGAVGIFTALLLAIAMAISLLDARLEEHARRLAASSRSNEQLEARVRERTARVRDSEIATLNMMQDVVAAKARLVEVNASLEKKVAERTAELREAKDRAEAADRLKSQFLANMSHELRTPLNAVIGFTGTLLMRLPGPLNAAQEEQLNIVQTSARHLLSLINDLLDLAKIEAGRLELHPESLEAKAVLDGVVAMLRPLAEKKGLALIAESADGARVTTDARALKQILLNLGNNAIKFTDAGSVTIGYGPEPGGGVRFEVRDTGIGIKPEDQQKLFTAFTQMDSTHREGTGLGLHLSRRLARLIGGTIGFSSEYGKGSRFWLSLPPG